MEIDFSEIYKENIKTVYRYVYSLVGSKERAEDICSQATMIALQKYASQAAGIENPKAWFIAIARNCMLNEFKRKKWSSSLPEDFEEIDSEMTISEILVREEDISEVRNLFEQLDPESREVVGLKVWEELQFNEIAEITGMKESSVKTLYYRAIEKIRSSYFKEQKRDKKMFMLVLGSLSGMGKLGDFKISGAFSESLQDKFLDMNTMESVNGLLDIVKNSKGLLSAAVVSTVAVGVAGYAVYTQLPDNSNLSDKDAVKTCQYGGKEYEEGEQFTDDCNTCRCQDGQASCTLMACGSDDDASTDEGSVDITEGTVPFEFKLEGDGNTILTFNGEMPADAQVTILKNTDSRCAIPPCAWLHGEKIDMLFVPELTQGVDIDYTRSLTSHELVASGGTHGSIYRVQFKTGSNTTTVYMNYPVTASGSCEGIYGNSVMAPCGYTTFSIFNTNRDYALIYLSGSDSKAADALMKTLAITSNQ